jgi:lysophospholipase L1-like esterase
MLGWALNLGFAGTVGAVFSPTDIAGLKFWLDVLDEDSLFQDVARTIPAVLNADPVGGPEDKSGCGNYVTQATAGKRPLLYLATANGYAIRALRFDGVDDVLAKVDFELAQPNTLFVVGKTRPYGKVNQMIVGSTAAGLNNLYQYDGITMVYAGTILNRTGNDDDWCIFRVTFNGAASVLGIDDRTETINPGTLNRVGLGIGAKPDSSTPLALDVCEVLLYDTALSDSDVADVIAYFRSRHNVLWPLSGRQIVCDGDSLTQGLGLADMVTQSYPAQLSTLHPSQARVRNFGYWGQRLTTMTADAVVQIDTLYGGVYTANLIVVWGGTNDIVVDGVTPATTYARLKTYVNARKAAGWQVVVVTMLPRWGYDEAKRQMFNDLVRDGFVSDDLDCDEVADVEDDDRIGAEDAHLDLTYYQADQTHLNLAGVTILTGIVDAALKRARFWPIVPPFRVVRSRTWPVGWVAGRRALAGGAVAERQIQTGGVAAHIPNLES